MRNITLKGTIVLIVLIPVLVCYSKVSDNKDKNLTATVNAGIKIDSNSEKNKAEQVLEDKRQQLSKLSDSLANDLSKVQSLESIEAVMKDFLESHSKYVSTVYFATPDGSFYLQPKQQLPSSYDPRIRPWYKGALESERYFSEPFNDIVSNKNFISTAKAIYKDKSLTGVLGIDGFAD